VRLCLSCSQRFDAIDWKCPGCGFAPEFQEGRPVFAPSLSKGDGSDAEYRFDELCAAETWHFWFRSRTRLIVWALSRYFPNARRILDMGCGTGLVLSGLRDAFPEAELTGTDSILRALSFAGSRLSGVGLFQMDARQIPFEEEFDVIGAFDVLEHITEDERVLSEMFRATRPGGGVLLTVPQHAFLWSSLDEFSHHRRRYTRRDLASKARTAGFEVLRTTSFVSLLLPLLIVSRLFQARHAHEVDTLAEHRVGPLANAGLGGVLTLERALIRLGISFPLGGSLLLVARRPPPGRM
jgi:SAM-dependent methyltransferase